MKPSHLILRYYLLRTIWIIYDRTKKFRDISIKLSLPLYSMYRNIEKIYQKRIKILLAEVQVWNFHFAYWRSNLERVEHRSHVIA